MNALARLAMFRLFEDNWDSYDGHKPTEEAIVTAERCVVELGEPYSVGPLPDGGVWLMYRPVQEYRSLNIEFTIHPFGYLESVMVIEETVFLQDPVPEGTSIAAAYQAILDQTQPVRDPLPLSFREPFQAFLAPNQDEM